MFTNQTKRIPYVFRSLSILLVILAFTIYDISPKQANAQSLDNNSNAQPESISFAPKVDFVTGLGPTHIVIGDLDKDGLNPIWQLPIMVIGIVLGTLSQLCEIRPRVVPYPLQ